MERLFKRLTLQPSAQVCGQCRRSFASGSALRQQQHSQRGPYAALLQSSRQDAKSAPQRSNPPTRSANSSATSSAAPSSAPNRPRTASEIAEATIRDVAAARQQREAVRTAEAEKDYPRLEYDRQIPRRWKVGDVYAPHDLTGVEMAKWKKLRRQGRERGGKRRWDVIDQLGINPIDHYKNFAMMSEYMSEMGRIKHRNETGLRPVNQRRMAKAIRRAIGTGLMPGVHRHPEILRIEMQEKGYFND